MITSPQNDKLTLIRKLAERKHREREDMFAAEGEDLVGAAAEAGWDAEAVLRSGQDVEPALLDAVSALGSGTRVIGIYRRRWAAPAGELAVYLHGVGDPGNVGAIIRSAHAFGAGPVILGPGCADPFSPKAVRASMGSIFALPPARCDFGDLKGTTLALDAGAASELAETDLQPPLVVCLGAERNGLPGDLLRAAGACARIPLADGGPGSLNVAMAASVALYELANRMARRV